MALTYQAIATTTVGSGGAANIEFTSIPQTYTDLLLSVSARSETNNTGNLWLQINNSTAVTNKTILLYGDGSSANTAKASNSDYIWSYSVAANFTANVFSNQEYYFPNYTNSANKTVMQNGVTENNATTAFTVFSSAEYNITAAITSIKLSIYFSGDINQHSTATLYGIKNTV